MVWFPVLFIFFCKFTKGATTLSLDFTWLSVFPSQNDWFQLGKMDKCTLCTISLFFLLQLFFFFVAYFSPCSSSLVKLSECCQWRIFLPFLSNVDEAGMWSIGDEGGDTDEMEICEKLKSKSIFQLVCLDCMANAFSWTFFLIFLILCHVLQSRSKANFEKNRGLPWLVCTKKDKKLCFFNVKLLKTWFYCLFWHKGRQ